MNKKNYEHVRFWCFKVLPLVYDDSLSYYEVLCKVRDKLNEMIDIFKDSEGTIHQMQEAIAQIQEWIDNFDTSYAIEIIKSYLATMIFVELDDVGHVVFTIPDKWESITFETTGYDVELEIQPEFGHLVLSY